MSRLINADELKRILNLDEDYDVFARMYKVGVGFSYENLVRIIDKCPTEDVVEHGHWIDGQCSQCLLYDTTDYDTGFIKYKYERPSYCMWCGAKMDQK